MPNEEQTRSATEKTGPAKAAEANRRSLEDICREVLAEQYLVIASNRGPVTYERDAAGGLRAKRGSGGVVTALLALTNYTPVTWVAAALSETDRELSEQAEKGQPGPHVEDNPNLRLRLVNIDQDSFDKYLNVISNPLLWFVQHEMDELLDDNLTRSQIADAWQAGYVKANQEFARAVLDEAARPDTAPYVIFHDYQLYLAPALTRQQRPDLNLLHFTHIPWPGPDIWRKVPAELVRSICSSLLACDIVGFQTSSAAGAFAETCQEFLNDITCREVEGGGYDIERPKAGGATIITRVRAYPISVDPQEVLKAYRSDEARQWREKLEKVRAGIDCLIVRVDRLDPNKNILTGFMAYRELLETRPELRGRVKFLALLVPTRENVPEYRDYKDQTFELINQINARYGTAGWQPVEQIYGNNYPRALAALSLADVVLVNSIADGMNLVAKEASIVNERNSALVLSRQTGAWEELGDGSIGVDPADASGTARGLAQAIALPAAERARRARLLAGTVLNSDLSAWLAAHLTDLAEVQKEKIRTGQ